MVRTGLPLEKVAETWSALCARYDREMRSALCWVAAVVLVGVLFGLYRCAPVPALLVSAALAVVFAHGILRIFLGAILMCPICTEPPAAFGKYSHPRRARRCEHCGCELAG